MTIHRCFKIGYFRHGCMKLLLPSKVNMSDAVPAIAPTVITMLASKPAPLWSRQDTVVAAIHDRHKHDCWSNIVVAEKSVLPKLRPLTVTDIPADVAEFEIEYDTTGAV